jgi:hypothetical protein
MDIKVKLILLAILAIFVVHAVNLNFIQDDAFISYRYVRNFVNGRGLVFNPGERVEGYTNFLWIMLLALLASVGSNIILASKILGILSGCVVILLLYKLSRLLMQSMFRSPDREIRKAAWFSPLFPPMLLAANGTFAYWSVSGLETVFFTAAVLFTVTLYFTNQRLMVVLAALSSLIRPEGVLVFAVLILHKLVSQKGCFKPCLLYSLGFLLLLMPYLIFKISYYGDLLPNSFYAKTGLSIEYLRAGLAYFWLFLRHYGLWGVLYLLPLVLSGRLGRKGRLILFFLYSYTLYIIIIGGDVLSAHRFFLPLLPFLYFFVGVALMGLYQRLKRSRMRQLMLLFLVIALSLLTFWLPRAWLLRVRRLETGLCMKMAFKARMLRESFCTDFTLSCSTIGAISYYSDARVIDMLGLTDPYIAKHPEQLPGISSTWREKRFNTRYLLSQDPDVILFSTGGKPSAPAEKALFMSSQFRENYYRYYFPERQILWQVFKRKGKYTKENRIFPDARFVDVFIEAVVADKKGDLLTCLVKLEKVLEVGPEDFSWIYDHMAYCHYLMGDWVEAKKIALKAVEIDDYCVLSHNLLRQIYWSEGDTAGVFREQEKLELYNPEMKIKLPMASAHR